MVIILQLVRRQIIGLLQIRRYRFTKVKVVKSKDVKTRQQTQYKGIVHFPKQTKHATLQTIIEHNKHYCQKKSPTTCLQSKLNDVITSSALLSNSKGLFWCYDSELLFVQCQYQFTCQLHLNFFALRACRCLCVINFSAKSFSVARRNQTKSDNTNRHLSEIEV